MERFTDRTEAGKALARLLAGHDLPRPVVLALPRGGVPVALPVAQALRAPLDLVMVRKIGVPAQPELAAAAVAEAAGGARDLVVNEGVARMAGLDAPRLDALAEGQLAEIARRRALYLAGRPPIDLAGRSAIVVDDGVATGATVRAALRAVRRGRPARVVLAIPCAPPDVAEALGREVDLLVCPLRPPDFGAVGLCYRRFDQVEDAEVVRMMATAPGDRPAS